MPLHLLGKKSWNVYNNENIARVRKDEAEAAAKEEAEEQRMQDLDAARRTAILRGETPPPLPDSDHERSAEKGATAERYGNSESIKKWEREDRRKRRRLRGEDDTDRDIRVARMDSEIGTDARRRLEPDRLKQESNADKNNDKSIVDARGNISLFSEPEKVSEKKSYKEKQAERKRRDDEEGAGMRFTDATGYNVGPQAPWYSQKNRDGLHDEGKDAFGNPDAQRHDRDRARAITNDPMAFMQRAQTQLKTAERDRSDWEAKRHRELEELKRDQRASKEHKRRRREHEKSRHRHESPDSLEGFSLEGTSTSKSHRSERPPSRHRHHSSRHHHRRRSSSPHRQ